MAADGDTFRRLVEALPDAVLRLGRDGTVLYCNPSFTAMYGIVADDIVGRTIPELSSPERSALVMDMIDRVVSDRVGTEGYEFLAGPSTGVDIEARSVPELGPDGEVESILVVIREVSEFRRAVRELKRSEERFESMVRYSSDIITVLEPDGTWRSSSAGGARLLGYPEGYDPSGGIFSLIHPDDVETAASLFERCVAGDLDSDECVELRVIDTRGDEHIVESVMQNLIDNPAVRGVVINTRDITARRRAEEATRLSEESFRSLADAVPVGIFDIGLDGTRHFENQFMLDLSDGVVPEPPEGWRALVHPDHQVAVRQAFIEAITTCSMQTIRHRLPDATGRDRWVELRLAPVLDKDHQPVRILGTLTDVSAVVETEERLAAARDAALEASRLKSQFLANVSHEIRTPLNAILGMAALLLDEDLSEEQTRRVTTLRSAGSQLLELLQDVLDLSRIEAGQLGIDHVRLDLREVVSDAVGLFLASAHEQGIDLRMEGTDQDLPLVVGDPLRLRQILVNLVSNAVKFTEAGSVLVRVAAVRVPVERGSATGDGVGGGAGSVGERVEVRIDVVDTGPGIEADRQEGLFEPFHQGDASTTRRHGGTGLGLAICRELAELMGGRIDLDSARGKGSCFTAVIPFDVLPDDADGIASARVLPGRSPADGGSRATGFHVLVVEDNEVNRQVVTAYLRKLGCTFQAVPDGVDAVRAVEGTFGAPRSFDVVLMDCQMPVMDGFEATTRIRAAEAVHDVPPVRIVAVTAGAMADERERCFDVGMDGYLAKPFSLAGLEQALLESGTRAEVDARNAFRDSVEPTGASEARSVIPELVPERIRALRQAIDGGSMSAGLDALADIVAVAEAVHAEELSASADELAHLLQAEVGTVPIREACDRVERVWRGIEPMFR